jgi:hypothetical protein
MKSNKIFTMTMLVSLFLTVCFSVSPICASQLDYQNQYYDAQLKDANDNGVPDKYEIEINHNQNIPINPVWVYLTLPLYDGPLVGAQNPDYIPIINLKP